MLGSRKLTALLGSAPAPTADLAALKAYTKALQGAGLALFLVVPGGKEPAECRTTVTKNKEIRAAKEAGLPESSVNGLHMATTDPKLLDRWLTKYRKDREDRDPNTPVNMALEVGRSRLLVVDVDTEAELEAFRRHWADAEGDENLAWVAPTVSSPGVQADDGTWIHRGGGHFYFTLPDDVTLPDRFPSVITMGEPGAQWVIRAKDAYVLIPPSVRKEGAYWLSGTEHAAPAWLLQVVADKGVAIAARAEARAERVKSRAAGGDLDPIETWGLATPWDEILEAQGWTFSGRVDKCTCPIWTRPGNPANTKSATVHGDSCTDERFDPSNPPIHVWSDNVDGGLAAWIGQHGKTLSKLQFIAATAYDGDVTKAMGKLGIEATGGAESNGAVVSNEDLGIVSGAALDEDLMTPAPAKLPPEPAPAPAPEVDAFATPATAGQGDNASSAPAEAPQTSSSEPAGDEDESDEYPLPRLEPFDYWRNLEPPEFLVEGWIEDKALSAVIGPSGVGKSAVVLDLSCHVALGMAWHGRPTKRTKVLYIAGEGASGAAARLRAWEAAHDANVGQDLYMIAEAVLVGTNNKRLWPWLAEQVRQRDIGLVIFDTLARMSLGLEENSASDMGKAVARYDRLRREGDTGVMVVHHTTRGANHGRGSTAILGALDSEILVTEPEDAEEANDDPKADGPKLIQAKVTKQKNAEDGDERLLTLVPSHGSIVVGDGRGAIGDPFAAQVVEITRPAPETATELAIRIRDYLGDLSTVGASRVEIVRDVDPRTHRLRTHRDEWKEAVLKAVDAGIRTELLERLPGSTTRYRRGPTTAEEARERVAT
ncbi:DNA primase/polymerase/helicase [Gordonia phage Widow]|nr:DNA primase/polymerase/helicase [Gordonia phage Widow]